MTFNSIADMAQDNDLLLRVAACAAKEGMSNPVRWAQSYMWKLAASPGWEDAWQYAVETKVEGSIGKNDDVINDDMILSAVQNTQEKAVQSEGPPPFIDRVTGPPERVVEQEQVPGDQTVVPEDGNTTVTPEQDPNGV